MRQQKYKRESEGDKNERKKETHNRRDIQSDRSSDSGSDCAVPAGIYVSDIHKIQSGCFDEPFWHYDL